MKTQQRKMIFCEPHPNTFFVNVQHGTYLFATLGLRKRMGKRKRNNRKITTPGLMKNRKTKNKETKRSLVKPCTIRRTCSQGIARNNHPSVEMETGDGRFPFFPPFSRVQEFGNKRKRHKQHNPWPYPAALLEPIYWFWARSNGTRAKQRRSLETTSPQHHSPS